MPAVIAAIIACRNEADIIELSMRHILAEGISRVYVSVGASSDGTAGIVESLAAETGKLDVRHDPDPIFHQADVMNNLAALAGADGAEIVVPFDADEFPYALNGEPLAVALADSPHNKWYMPMYRHHDWTRREVNPKPLPKVAFRWQPGARLTMGQHEVGIDGGAHDVIALREWQYRNFENFVAKRDLWLSALSPDDEARGDVSHYQRLRNFAVEDMRREYNEILAIETIYDPIPSRAL